MYIPIINVNQDCIKFIGNQYQKAFYMPKIDKYFFSEYILWITDCERYKISKCENPRACPCWLALFFISFLLKIVY